MGGEVTPFGQPHCVMAMVVLVVVVAVAEAGLSFISEGSQ